MSLGTVLRELKYKIRGQWSTEKLIKQGLTVGKNFRRNEECIIDPSHCWLIDIGDNVVLAPRVHILAHDASMWDAIGYTKIAPVKIGNNVFIGAGTIILPGVTIGDDVVIGAGSIVSRDIESNSVAVGSPAKVIHRYDEYIEKTKQQLERNPKYDDSYTLRNPDITDDMKRKMKDDLKNSKIGFVV